MIMSPQKFSDIEASLRATNSLRGALFVLKNSFPEFMGCDIGYEFFVQKHGFKRGDVIVETTLPHSITQQYTPSGGQNADPVIESIPTLQNRHTIDIHKLTSARKSKYFKHKFFTALSHGGVHSITVYGFLPENSRGFGGLSIMEKDFQASLQYPSERYAEIGYFFHRYVIGHGLLLRALEINEREQLVLVRMAEGKTAQDVAQELNVTPRTIEMRLQSARKKLKSRTTTEAVFKSVCYGIL